MTLNQNKKRKIDLARNAEDFDLVHGEFFLNSGNSTRSSGNKEIWNMSEVIEDIKLIRLSAASVPVTFYNINSSNNEFIFEEAAGGSQTVVIPVGMYTSTTYAAALKAGMEALSNGTLTYTVAVNSLTLKLDISATGTFTTGVGSNQYISGYTVAQTTATSHSGDSVHNMLLTNNIYLRGTFGNYLGKSSTILDGSVINNVFSSIPITENTGGLIQIDFNQQEYYTVAFDAQDFEFWWTDALGNELDFNGAPWTIKIQYVKAKNRN